ALARPTPRSSALAPEAAGSDTRLTDHRFGPGRGPHPRTIVSWSGLRRTGLRGGLPPRARHQSEKRRRQARIEGVTDAVAEEVEGEHRHRDGEAREEREPPRRHQRRDRVREHVAPRRRRGWDAHPEKTEGRLDHD